MHWPAGTTIVDVADPRHPRALATIEMPDGWHSHKVRAANGIMIVNHEKLGQSGSAEFGGGIGIHDVSRPSTPRLITKWRTAGRGVHRYDFDGRYVDPPPTAEGYVGNIVMILDLVDPARPMEVGRWWIPGQWKAGGEPYPWDNWVSPRCHHPLRMGDRSLCQLLAPRALHSGCFRHVTAEGSRAHQYQPGVSAPDRYLPANSAIAQGAPDHGGGGRGCRQAETIGALLHLDLRHHGRANAAADRDVPGARARPRRQSAAGDERLPSAVGTVPRHRDPVRHGSLRDCVSSTSRIPSLPASSAIFCQIPADGEDRPSSNDVTIDDRGLVYLVDRVRGVDIIETNAFG